MLPSHRGAPMRIRIAFPPCQMVQIVLVLLAALALPVILTAQPTEKEPQEDPEIYRFESFVDMVSVAVAVTNKKGDFVTELTAEQFQVFEDGKRQEVRLFAAGLDESWADLPPDMKEDLSGRQVIGLLMDSSGSMEDHIDLVHAAAIKFLTNIPKTEELFIMNFDENIRLSQYSSDDQRLIGDRIYEIEPEGWTALYDAVGTFLERIYGYDGRKTLVIFSDGVDSRSHLGFSDVLDMVKMSDVTIHSIHFGAGHRPASSRTFEEGRFLRTVAQQSGGSYAMATTLEEMDELYDQILEELFSQYTIGYVSNNTKRDGKYRKIKVEVDLDDVKVRARKGYYGPEKLEGNQ